MLCFHKNVKNNRLMITQSFQDKINGRHKIQITFYCFNPKSINCLVQPLLVSSCIYYVNKYGSSLIKTTFRGIYEMNLTLNYTRLAFVLRLALWRRLQLHYWWLKHPIRQQISELSWIWLVNINCLYLYLNNTWLLINVFVCVGRSSEVRPWSSNLSVTETPQHRWVLLLLQVPQVLLLVVLLLHYCY